MKVRRGGSTETKVEQQMTPMIDVVFQLLTFFIMSFKVVLLEGDFNIKMPLGQAAPGSITDDSVPPMKLRMTADANGRLTNMKLNEDSFGTNGWDSLRGRIAQILTSAGGPTAASTAEVELDCDYNLKYEFVIKAITHVSGYPGDDGNIVRLVEKVKFAPPKGGPGG